MLEGQIYYCRVFRPLRANVLLGAFPLAAGHIVAWTVRRDSLGKVEHAGGYLQMQWTLAT